MFYNVMMTAKTTITMMMIITNKNNDNKGNDNY